MMKKIDLEKQNTKQNHRGIFYWIKLLLISSHINICNWGCWLVALRLKAIDYLKQKANDSELVSCIFFTQ